MHQFIVNGTQGSFVKYGLDPQEEALKAGGMPIQESLDTWGTEHAEQWGTLDTQLQGLYFKGKIETIPGCYQKVCNMTKHAHAPTRK